MDPSESARTVNGYAFLARCFETVYIVGGNSHDLGAASGQFLMSLTQLRKVLFAIGSKEPSQENQDDGPFGDGVGEFPLRPVRHRQIDCRSGFADGCGS
jgi:hypothetical protein